MEDNCYMYVWSFGQFSVYFMAHIFCGHLVHFLRFGILCHEKSGNPVRNNILNIFVSVSYTDCKFCISN
jgi:hypothetical protein